MVGKKIESQTKYFARISKTKHKLLGERGENQEQGRLLGRVEFCSFCSSNQVRVGLHFSCNIYMHDFMKIGLKIVVLKLGLRT